MAPKNGGENEILFFWFIWASDTYLYTFSRSLITNLTLNLDSHPPSSIERREGGAAIEHDESILCYFHFTLV